MVEKYVKTNNATQTKTNKNQNTHMEMKKRIEEPYAFCFFLPLNIYLPNHLQALICIHLTFMLLLFLQIISQSSTQKLITHTQIIKIFEIIHDKNRTYE